jgi:hypothetical protein
MNRSFSCLGAMPNLRESAQSSDEMIRRFRRLTQNFLPWHCWLRTLGAPFDFRANLVIRHAIPPLTLIGVRPDRFSATKGT